MIMYFSGRQVLTEDCSPSTNWPGDKEGSVKHTWVGIKHRCRYGDLNPGDALDSIKYTFCQSTLTTQLL
jgi:hypothetical protein